MKKMNWKHYLLLFVFLILGTILLTYKIGEQYMWTDEIFSFHAAKMIIQKGQAIYDSGLNYTRSGIYHKLLAWSMQTFGINEFGSRIINVPTILATGLISFFFTKDLTKKSKNTFIISLTSAILYVTSTFSIALARETRMYAMLTLFFTLATYAFYKGIISKQSTKILTIGKWKFRYNIPWICILLLSLYIAYNTQPITIIFGVGILMYYIYQSIFKRKKEDILITIAISLLGILVIFLQYDTLNIYTVFKSLSPDWATNPPVYMYYSAVLARNLPGIALLSPILIFTIFNKRKKTDILLFSVLSTYIIFMSLQKAQGERYIQTIIPILIILFVVTMYRTLSKILKKKLRTKEFLLATLIFLVGAPHIYLLQKEIQEIDTYTKTSLGIHKKMKFDDLFTYLETKDLNNYIIIADYHSAFTLYEKGYNIDYILVQENDVDVQKGITKDPYFNIPYTIYEKDFKELVRNQPRIVITRDYEKFTDIEEILVRYDALEKPRVYR